MGWVLYPRRLSILRGQNEFIRATQLHPEYQYLAVGQATREDTEKKAADWAKTLPHLKFIHKEMDGMEEVYQQSDIAVVPTKACEGLSLSLLERYGLWLTRDNDTCGRHRRCGNRRLQCPHL